MSLSELLTLIRPVVESGTFALLFCAMLLWAARVLAVKLDTIYLASLIESQQLNALKHSLDLHNITVSGVNPSVDLNTLDDESKRQIVAMYQSMEQRSKETHDTIERLAAQITDKSRNAGVFKRA